MNQKELNKFMRKMHCMRTKVYRNELLPKGNFWKPDRESMDVLGVYYDQEDQKWHGMYSDNRLKLIRLSIALNSEEEACSYVAKRIVKIREMEAKALERYRMLQAQAQAAATGTPQK